MTRRFQYDGAEVAAVYNTLGGIKERYVRGAGADEIVVCYGECYAGATGSSKAWLIADERGTIIAGTDSSGATLFKNVYDEYGKPGAANQGRFQYTGKCGWPRPVSITTRRASMIRALGVSCRPTPSAMPTD